MKIFEKPIMALVLLVSIIGLTGCEQAEQVVEKKKQSVEDTVISGTDNSEGNNDEDENDSEKDDDEKGEKE
jgi:uncharacterized lipoprotein YehR (DUF1307 family)